LAEWVYAVVPGEDATRALAPAGGNFKDGSAVLERPLYDVAPEFATREGRAGHRMRYREYLCPVTGLRVDSEIVKEGDEALHDIEIGLGS
jgi:N-methylhydantoinase B